MFGVLLEAGQVLQHEKYALIISVWAQTTFNPPSVKCERCLLYYMTNYQHTLFHRSDLITLGETLSGAAEMD